MKILLGGIPLGCDNIGDEAILACVIAIFRRLFPEAELSVSTGDIPGVERKFRVRGVPLYGFDPACPAGEFGEAVRGFDFYVWAGATGLSDYPEAAARLLEQAQRNGVRTIVWNVGMNDRFNPAYFRLGGRKARLADFARKITGLDWPGIWERRCGARMRRRLAAVLEKCSLIVLRDAESLAELRKCGRFPEAVSGADSAVLLRPAADADMPWGSEAEQERFAGFRRRVALCLSAQSPVRDTAQFAAWMDRAAEADPALNFVMIPMNPDTDFLLMDGVRRALRHPERALLTCFREPEEVQNLVGKCDLVISSRLHLMILGLNRLVPAVGIARGSKIATFLGRFGLPTCGSTDSVDYDALTRGMNHLLNGREAFVLRAGPVRDRMLADLERAEEKLRQAVGSGR